MGKTIVAYFSASGVTARAAREVAAASAADFYEIAPKVPYSAADLNWNDRMSRSSREMDDPASRPVIAGLLPDLSSYDTVLLGFPIWWYAEPRIVDTFVESVDLTGKTVVPFATSGGSGISGAEKSLREKCPDARWAHGKLLNGVDPAAWARSLCAGDGL